MLNTPYEQGWRDASEGKPNKYPPCTGHLNFERKAYINGYRDAERNGYAVTKVQRPGHVTPAERPSAKDSDAVINGNALHRFVSQVREVLRGGL